MEYANPFSSEEHNILYVTVSTGEPIPSLNRKSHQKYRIALVRVTSDTMFHAGAARFFEAFPADKSGPVENDIQSTVCCPRHYLAHFSYHVARRSE